MSNFSLELSQIPPIGLLDGAAAQPAPPAMALLNMGSQPVTRFKDNLTAALNEATSVADYMLFGGSPQQLKQEIEFGHVTVGDLSSCVGPSNPISSGVTAPYSRSRIVVSIS